MTPHGEEAPPIWNVYQLITRLKELLAPEVIGFYRSFEITEILGFHADNDAQPVNFFTLIVAESASPPPKSGPVPLTNQRIKLKSTKWKFGVYRHRISIDDILATLEVFQASGQWVRDGHTVATGQMAAVPPQFVPTDGPTAHPWNALLKNNHWEGSHVLELFDRKKAHTLFLIHEPRLLKELAEAIRPIAKISIDGLSDRLGNIVFQLPVTVLSTVLNSYDSDGAFGVQPIWHPSVEPRILRVSCEKYEDTTIEGFDSKDVSTEMTRFYVSAPGGGVRYILWDDKYRVILGASSCTMFFTSVGFDIFSTSLGGSARTFSIRNKNGELEETWIPVHPPTRRSVVGNSPFRPHEPWRSQRVFKNGLHELKERKEFIQYGGSTGKNRVQALEDIRFLLRAHGETGAWLWDPYLSADDILETLFYNKYENADLRALSSGKPPPVSDKEKSDIDRGASWSEAQRDRLNTAKGNQFGLKLEFRVRKGNSGWDFHDRFLIFPSATGGAVAWSLGTSVNSIGLKHHILQKVQDGELIRQAFLDLWNELDASSNLVWKNT